MTVVVDSSLVVALLIVARLAADPEDRRARQEALRDLDALEAPWPS